jgi:hypothetical protein
MSISAFLAQKQIERKKRMNEDRPEAFAEML